LRVQPWAEEGMALLEKTAGQGHAYAMYAVGSIHDVRKDHKQAAEWYSKGAEAGLPAAMHNLGAALDMGKGVAAPDYPAAAGWFRRAAVAGRGDSAVNLCHMDAVGRGRIRNIMPTTSSFTL